MSYLTIAAIIPVAALCFFVYMKDKNKEPKGLLAGIFFLGFFSVIPILVCELLFDYIFPMKNAHGFISIFLSVLFGVALYEESFKWLITKFLGYNNKSFDEVYDVIVYSVFASLGFACFENIMYVLQNGLGNAFLRAVLSVPGHTCFAISMGYFFSKAKVGEINGNKKVYNRNMVLSIIVPIILHTFYDALIFSAVGETLVEELISLIPFLIFYIVMVIICFITVDKTARVQQNLTNNLNNGTIARNNQGYLYYVYPTTPIQATPIVPVSNMGQPVVSSPEPAMVSTQPVIVDTQPVMEPVITATEEVSISPVVTSVGAVFPDNPVSIPTSTIPVTTPQETSLSYQGLTYCPICGKPTKGAHFCARCGFKLD